MKKITLLLCLLAFARANTFGQCGSCTSVIPLLDNDFSQWNGNGDPYTWNCTDVIGTGWSPFYVNTGSTLRNSYLPNWYRINGTPQINSSSPPTNFVFLKTIGPAGTGNHCGSTGSQGIAANYPFLAHGLYQVTLNVISGSNQCLTASNASVNVVATSGLSEAPAGPSYYVEAPVATSVIFPPWQPATNSIISASPYYFCASSPLPTNQNQLYIYVNQGTPEAYTYGGDPDDQEPYGLGLDISSVDVALCNQCSQNSYRVTANSSVDPTSHAPFSSGGLFVDADILIDGPYTSNAPFTNNPGLNELLWAKYIEIGRSATTGNAFLATVNGTFFEMLPNSSCSNVCSLDPIGGPSSMCIGDVFYTFTNSTAGGTWSSSNPAVVAINPTTGYVGGTPPSTPPGTVTITYTKNGCSVTKTVMLVNCQPGGRMMQVIANDMAAANDMVDVYPNPAHNNITISYASQSSQLLKIGIKDVNGGVVHAESVMCNSGDFKEHSVDISSLAPGFYFVELTFGNQHVVKKIIKE